MKDRRTKAWRRLASMRASRRRHTELAPRPHAAVESGPVPPLESPDEDRELLPHPHALALQFVPIPRPEHA